MTRFISLILLLSATGLAASAGMPIGAPAGRFAPVPGWAGVVMGISPFVTSESQSSPRLAGLNGVLEQITARLEIDRASGLQSMEFVRFMPQKYQADPATFSAQPKTRQAAALLKSVRAAGRALDKEASELSAKMAAGAASTVEADRLTAIRENSFYLSDTARRRVEDAFAGDRALEKAKLISMDKPVRQGAAYEGAPRRDDAESSPVSAEDSRGGARKKGLALEPSRPKSDVRGGIVTSGPVKIKNTVVSPPNGAKFSVRSGAASDVSKVTDLIHGAFSIWKERGLDLGPMHQTDRQTAAHLVGKGYVAEDSKGELTGTFSLDEGAVRRIGKTTIHFTEGDEATDYTRIGDAKTVLPAGPLLVFKKAAVKRGKANAGLGSEFYALAEKIARENGYSGVILEAVKEAGWLYDWYVRLGFKPIGSHRYPGKKIDTILMIKSFRARRRREQPPDDPWEGVRLMKSPAELVQIQVDAYNAHDLEVFLATYAEEVVLLKGDNKQTLKKAVLRERYGKLFRENPELKCEIRSREVVGNIVTDEEYVTGFADGVVRRVRARYELADGLIRAVSFSDLTD